MLKIKTSKPEEGNAIAVMVLQLVLLMVNVYMEISSIKPQSPLLMTIKLSIILDKLETISRKDLTTTLLTLKVTPSIIQLC